MNCELWSLGWQIWKHGRVIGVVAIMALGTSVTYARESHSIFNRNVLRESAFDGTWSVVIETDRGRCDRDLRYGIDIVNGEVEHEGQPYGRVTPNGNVRVALALGEQHAEGVGRLSRNSGRGVWRGVGELGVCTGRWFAERRDSNRFHREQD
jgi:hypothetical protein